MILLSQNPEVRSWPVWNNEESLVQSLNGHISKDSGSFRSLEQPLHGLPTAFEAVDEGISNGHRERYTNSQRYTHLTPLIDDDIISQVMTQPRVCIVSCLIDSQVMILTRENTA